MRTLIAFAVSALAAALCAAAPGSFRIMTYNIRHGADIDMKLDLRRAGWVIDAEKPRFAGLQEVDMRTARIGGRDTCAVLEKVTGMKATFARAIDFGGGEYGNALLSREEPLSVRRVPLPGAEKRVLLMCEFDDCWVGVTHLAVDSERARAESVAIIRDAVAGCAPKPVLLTGDWNSDPSSAVLADLGKFLNVLSPTNVATFHGDRGRYPGGNADPSRCIDYIAVDTAHASSFRVLDSRVLGQRTVSDHAPVMVEVDVASPARPAGAFTIASFNVRCHGDRGELRWYRRMPRVAEVVRDRGFDLFGVQEATPAEAAVLAEELPGFGRVGCGREKDRRGEAMFIYYRKSRFRPVEDGTFWLSETPDEPGSRYKGAGCPRMCTWALLEDRVTGRTFRYFNTHLDHVSSRARLDGMRVLLERGVRPAKARGETVFLTGDLNETLDRADSPETVAALAGPHLAAAAEINPVALLSTELTDALALSETPHAGPFRTFHGYTGEPLCRIDYVFATPDVRVLGHATVDDRPGGEFASDHYAVSATVVVR